MVRLTGKAQLTRNDAPKEKIVNEYKLGATVGRGSFSKVKWAVDDSGKGYAVKVLSRSIMERRMVAVFDKHGDCDRVPFREIVFNELEMLKGLQHDYIVSLHEVIDDPEVEDLYIIYEGLVGGRIMEYRDSVCGYTVSSDLPSTHQYWNKLLSCTQAGIKLDNGETLVFTEDLAQYMLPQLLEAVAYLHDNGIIHKDLKPENVLLTLPLPASDIRFCRKLCGLHTWPTVSVGPGAATDESDVVADDGCSFHTFLQRAGLSIRVCDFGSAVVTESPDFLINDAQGTPMFTPPECYEAKINGASGILGKPRDIWSVGCMLFSMLYGRCPFWEKDNFSMQLAIIDCNLVLPEGIISASAMDLINGLMKKEASDRLTATSGLNHPWLRNT